VVEVFVPKKRDKWGRRFGFVKYQDEGNEAKLGQRLEEVWFRDTRLKVNKAKFGKEKQAVVEERRLKEDDRGGGSILLPGKSFKCALVPEKGMNTVLGEERPCLKIYPSEELLELLQWAYVGELQQFLDAREVQQSLTMEGLSQIKVTTMGGNILLIQIEGNKVLDSVIKQHQEWWDTLFCKVSKWSSNLVASKRFIWLKVYRIPMHVWDEPLFKRLGSLFGTFVDFDEATISRKRLDFARILVSTERKRLVDEMVNISVMGAVYSLWVVKELGGRQWESEVRESREDDVTSQSSRENDVAYCEGRLFSDEEVPIPRLRDYGSLGNSKVSPLVESKLGSGFLLSVHEGPQATDPSKRDGFLIDPMACGQVASRGSAMM